MLNRPILASDLKLRLAEFIPRPTRALLDGSLLRFVLRILVPPES
jgi:hypothetical protein